MKTSEFVDAITDEITYCLSLLDNKGTEYALDEDRLLVFKRAADVQGETPKQALCGMLAKHIISVYDMCMSDMEFTKDRWREKITDSINYFLILWAMVNENG